MEDWGKKAMAEEDADLIIIGGGASGLMAGIIAAEYIKVLLLEQQEKVGRKLSATGNGKCNFTNADMRKEAFFQGQGKGFVEYALSIFPTERAIAFFKESGIYITEKNGYYYPMSGQAEIVREALLFRFLYGNSLKEKKKVKCKCNCRVTKLEKENGVFSVYLENGYNYRAKKVILACGSAAAPQLGGSQLGLILAKQMGHTIISMLPALCGLKTSYPGWNRAGHIRMMAEISIYCEKEKKILLGKEYGELQITAYGISGIPVFQLSGKVVRLLEKKEVITAVLNFFPKECHTSTLFDFFQRQKIQYPSKTILSILSGILPQKLSEIILIKVLGKQKKNKQKMLPIQFMDKEELQRLAHTIQFFELPIIGQTGFEHAQAASGGVSTEEVNPKTMESRLVPGLYFAGELMDIVGNCGGYNLHWAWASGYLAGISASGEKK